MVQFEIKITGKVQNVGFRYFTQKKASELHINGWVKNSLNGRSVEVVAQGNETDVKTFIDYLQNGPSQSRVDELKKYKSTQLSEFNGFRIKY